MLAHTRFCGAGADEALSAGGFPAFSFIQQKREGTSCGILQQPHWKCTLHTRVQFCSNRVCRNGKHHFGGWAFWGSRWKESCLLIPPAQFKHTNTQYNFTMHRQRTTQRTNWLQVVPFPTKISILSIQNDTRDIAFFGLPPRGQNTWANSMAIQCWHSCISNVQRAHFATKIFAQKKCQSAFNQEAHFPLPWHLVQASLPKWSECDQDHEGRWTSPCYKWHQQTRYTKHTD